MLLLLLFLLCLSLLSGLAVWAVVVIDRHRWKPKSVPRLAPPRRPVPERTAVRPTEGDLRLPNVETDDSLPARPTRSEDADD